MSGFALSLLVIVLGTFVAALMVLFHKTLDTARTDGTPAPPAPLGPALQAFAKGLTRIKRTDLATGAMRVEGLLRGHRVAATDWPVSPKFRSEVTVEAVVPVPLTATFVRGPRGPKLSSDREPLALFREPGPDQALRALLQVVDEVKLGLSGLEARSTESLGERSIVTIAETLITLASFVRTDAPARPSLVARLIGMPTRAPKVVERSAQVCPFCRDGIDASAQDAVACEGCSTLHHAACWAENRDRCTVRGCGNKRAERVRSD